MKENKSLDENRDTNMTDEEIEDLRKLKATMDKIDTKVDDLVIMLDRSRIKDYMMLTESRKKLFFTNVVVGLGRGLGQAVGVTALAAILFYTMSQFINLPIIGEHIAALLDMVEKARK